MASVSLAVLGVFHVALFPVVVVGGSGKFIGPRENHMQVPKAHGPADLLAELEKFTATSRESPKDRELVGEFEARLRHIFDLAPKDSDGRVDGKAARYALQRLFVSRHAWFVNGVARSGAIRSSSTIAAALDSGHHFSLHELARFAATLERLVHAENELRLREVFTYFGIDKTAPKNEREAKKVVEAFMATYLMHHVNFTHPFGVATALQTVSRTFPTWTEQKEYAESMRRSTFGDSESVASSTSSLWEACLAVVDELGGQYGRWQNKYCTEMQDSLMDMAAPGTGRVPLRKFWGGMLTGGEWMFSESEAFLQQVGALEGEAPNQVVVISNYIHSAAQCVSLSRYYDVCCVNECDTLLEDIERTADASSVPPQRLGDMVEALSSRTANGEQKLPAELRQRLQDIADHHGGVVPLHGRLFAQFLHHAYPVDCPYPTNVDVTVASEDWLHLQHRDAYVERDVAEAYIAAAGEIDDEGESAQCKIPWSSEEELFMTSMQASGCGGPAVEATLEPGLGTAVKLLLFAAAVSLSLVSASKRGEKRAASTNEIYV
eukprot:TRINITY_DN73153_c0_g1_i1.p1 TRINITY_DN73153_c0_g1~~TRINITY_DN73153_c0_g1_i1.p1  ORF type:complete len:549 (+),score=137.39 TRINITY_DN73153_c0_g1_i1:80-1726(+)